MAALVSVLVPFSAAGPERDTAWRWNRQRLERFLPKAEICIGAPDVVGSPGIFSRSLALNRAAEIATGEVLLVCDADTTYSTEREFHVAIGYALAGRWTLPERYVRIGSRVSWAWQGQPPGSSPPYWEDDVEEEIPFANSGVVAMPREAFDRVHGFDTRFKGWGGEDDAIRGALEALWGKPTRSGVALHLWHPRPQEDSVGGPYHAESMVLAARYTAASSDPDATLELIAERE